MTETPAAFGTRRVRLALGLLAGLAIAAGQAPFGALPLALAGMAGAAWLLARAPGWRAAAWTGFTVGVAYFAFALCWIVEPFLVDVARYGWMAPFALVFISAGMALFWTLGFGLAAWVAPGRRAALALAVTLPLAEMLRSYALTGFPWALPAYVWVGWAPMQWAAWVGPHGLGALGLLPSCVAACALSGPNRSGPGLAVAALLLAGLFAAPLLRGPAPTPASDAPRPVLRLVQPNAAQHLKWQPDMIPVFFERQLRFSEAPPAGPAPDVVIWSETAVPYMLDGAEPALVEMSAAAATAGAGRVITGIQRYDDRGYFNSLVTLGPEGEVTDLYDKHHLVPFGEYMPGRGFFARFGISGLAALDQGGYQPGPGPALVDLGAAGRALPLICYEAIFPQDLRGTERPDWLLQITNDAWFGSFSGPYQHLAQARMRAVEQGLPLVRVANTGVSAVIDARGTVLRSLPLNEAGWFDARLPAAGPATPYSRMGDLPICLALLVLAAGIALFTRRIQIDPAQRRG